MKGDGIPLPPASGPLLPRKVLFAGLRGAAHTRTPIRRRLARPSPKCAGKGAAGRESQQIGDVADGVARRAEVGQGQDPASLVQYLLVRGAGIAQLTLQRARAHVEDVRVTLLSE